LGRVLFLILIASLAHANKNTPLISPGLDDDHFWIHHYQEIQVFFVGQAVMFAIWLGVQFYDSFIKATDKTSDKIEQILEAQIRMQEDLKAVKNNMISKDEAHKLIEDKIEYADRIRKKKRGDDE